MIVRFERHESGPRVWVMGHRVHHFHAGAALVLLGSWLIVDDRADWPRKTVALPRVIDESVVGVTTSNATLGVW